MEQRPDEIVLRPQREGMLPRAETARVMAAARVDWAQWKATTADGTDDL